MELALGRYEVMITHDGYKSVRRWVTIHDADVSLDVALEPEKYKLTVRASPPIAPSSWPIAPRSISLAWSWRQGVMRWW